MTVAAIGREDNLAFEHYSSRVPMAKSWLASISLDSQMVGTHEFQVARQRRDRLLRFERAGQSVPKSVNSRSKRPRHCTTYFASFSRRRIHPSSLRLFAWSSPVLLWPALVAVAPWESNCRVALSFDLQAALAIISSVA